ncbi:MAG: hypothetical protein RIF32_01565 [Leptospirales bacterium]|jgi:hypothetical protein
MTYKTPTTFLRSSRRFAALLGLLLLATACDRGGEVLATYEGGEVTRAELRNMFAMIYGPEAESQATIDQQNQLITNYSLMKIAALEAKKQGLDSTDDVRNRTVLKELQSQLFAYNTYLRDNADDIELNFIEMQFVYLPIRASGDDTNDASAREAEAADLIKKLNEVKDDPAALEDLIYERTEHQRYKWLGGFLDPHCTSCRPNPLNFLTDPLKEAEKGTFIQIKSPEAIWLIRKYREYERSLDNLDGIFKDYHTRTMRIAKNRRGQLPEAEQNAPVFQQIIMDDAAIENLALQQTDRLKRTETNGILTNKLNDLRESKKLELLPPSRMQGEATEDDYKESTALFTIGERTYTYGDLNKELGDAADAVPFKEKLQILNSLIVPLVLLEDESEFAAVKENDDYEFMMQLRESEALASTYYGKNQPEVEISEQQIAEQYNIGRQNRFKGQSLAQARAAIRASLEGSQRQAGQMKVQGDLTQKYDLKIKRELLKANEL